MRINEAGVRWLWQHQPLLARGLRGAKIVGTLELSAYYEGHSHRVVSNRFHSPQSHETYIADQFAIEISLDVPDSTGWPKVKEVGLRHQSIARRYGVPVEDLHFYRNGEACLGLAYPWDPTLTLENLVEGLVEPFFYRLAYVDLYGLTAARADLWPEYSHGMEGHREHSEDVRRFSALSDPLSGVLDTPSAAEVMSPKPRATATSSRRS